MRYLLNCTTFRRMLTAAFGSLMPFLPLPCLANEPFTVATWNVGFIDRNVAALDLDGFLAEVDFDILLVNEIKNQEDLDNLMSAMGREDFHTAISSFENGSGNLEVGIISRFPLTEIVEFDHSPDNSGAMIAERQLERVNQSGIEDVDVSRGFLVAEVPELELFVIVSHFKSSRGRSGRQDFSNAQKRELVAAAVATHVLELLEDNPGHTVLFGGDVNVGVSDSAKNGTDLTDDRNDGYDDTHAILGGGLIEGLQMRSLAQDVDSTFVGNDNFPDFPNTGAIDVLYVTGPLAGNFTPAEAASDRFGSDHLAVFASTGRVNPPQAEISVEIVNALPNPRGADIGREEITLAYRGDGVGDISGWSLQDKAGNTYIFPNGTSLNPGNNVFTLTPPTMSLNNNGDAIILLNSSGVQQGPTFSYSSEDVMPDEQVR